MGEGVVEGPVGSPHVESDLTRRAGRRVVIATEDQGRSDERERDRHESDQGDSSTGRCRTLSRLPDTRKIDVDQTWDDRGAVGVGEVGDVGYPDRDAAGSDRGGHPGRGVLDRHAIHWIDTEELGGPAIGLRIRLPAVNVIAADDHGEGADR